MRREVGHSAPEAGRTEPATLARERDEPATTATVADNPEKPMGQDAALQECLDFVDYEWWQPGPIGVGAFDLGAIRPPVFGQHLIEDGVLGSMARGRGPRLATGHRECDGGGHATLSGN
jgi:hypothetical protein